MERPAASRSISCPPLRALTVFCHAKDLGMLAFVVWPVPMVSRLLALLAFNSRLQYRIAQISRLNLARSDCGQYGRQKRSWSSRPLLLTSTQSGVGSGSLEAGYLEMPAVAQSRNPLWGFQNVTPPAQKNSGCSSPFNRACLSPPSIHAMDAPICTLAHLKS